MHFWQALESLHKWERQNLPGADSPQGTEVLLWLLKSQTSPRPLKDLYGSSRISEPTIRACLKTFVALGFAVIESNGQDMRTRFARGTPKLESTVGEYQRRFQQVAQLARRETGGTPAASADEGEPLRKAGTAKRRRHVRR